MNKQKQAQTFQGRARQRFDAIAGSISAGVSRAGRRRYRASFSFRGKRFVLTVSSQRKAWQFLQWAEHQMMWWMPTVKNFRRSIEDFRDEQDFPELNTWYWNRKSAR